MCLSAKIAHQCILCCTWKFVRKLSCIKNQTSNEICHFLFFCVCCCCCFHWAREALNVHKSISWLCPSLVSYQDLFLFFPFYVYRNLFFHHSLLSTQWWKEHTGTYSIRMQWSRKRVPIFFALSLEYIVPCTQTQFRHKKNRRKGGLLPLDLLCLSWSERRLLNIAAD